MGSWTTLSPPTSGPDWAGKMIKKTLLLATVLACLLTGLSPTAAQTDIELSQSSAQADFPYSIDFNLAVESPAEITDVRLHYIVDRETFVQVVSEVIIDITPGTIVDASWSWDMLKTGGMPPGTLVEYWWSIINANGQEYVTQHEQLSYDDDRYHWRSLTEGDISLYWYYGNDAFAQELMQAAQVAITKLAEDTGAALDEPVRVYIYASSTDLRGAMIYPQEWAGGVAYTRDNAIAIGISPQNMDWGKRAIVHELAHLVTHQMTSNPYSSIPTWLNEGISMYAEGEMQPVYLSYLAMAVAQDSLFSVRSLASPFSADADKSYLSYAQSLSLVEFLIQEYGQEKIHSLLDVFRQGSTYDDAFISVYGFDMDGLNTLWREYAMEKY